VILPGHREPSKCRADAFSSVRRCQGRPAWRVMQTIQDGPAHRCNRCTSPTYLIRHEGQMRYRRHILLRLRPVRPLLHCKTVTFPTEVRGACFLT